MANELKAEVVDTGGRLPPFWDHGVVYFANLLAIFFGNEEESRLLREAIHGAESYGGRLVPILNLIYGGEENLLYLQGMPDAELLDYFREELGLGIPRLRLLSHQTYGELGRLAAVELGVELEALVGGVDIPAGFAVDGYVTDSTLAAIAGHLGLSTLSSPEGSRRGNNKLLLHQALKEAGLPVFETRLATSATEVENGLAALAGRGFRIAAVKAPLGASGIGLVRLPVKPDRRVADAVPELMFCEGPCLVQGWLEPGVDGVTSVSSPSVQMFISHRTVYLFDVTEQILGDDSVHQGNEAPPAYLEAMTQLRSELFRQAGIAGRWLHAQGFRGTASVDFLVIYRARDEHPSVYICEINARITGATYPAVLARYFRPGGAWLMRNLRLQEPMPGFRLLERLDHRGHLFRPSRRDGILPINFNPGPDGLVHKGQFLCLAPSIEACRHYLAEVERTLDIPWRYERD